MDFKLIVKLLREENDDDEKVCIEEKNILQKCILCKYYLKPTIWGKLLENFILKMFNIKKINW